MAEFDDLFASVREKKMWGTFVFIVKDGIVKKITYQRDFLNVQDALDALLSHEEQPGESDENDLHQKQYRRPAA